MYNFFVLLWFISGAVVLVYLVFTISYKIKKHPDFVKTKTVLFYLIWLHVILFGITFAISILQSSKDIASVSNSIVQETEKSVDSPNSVSTQDSVDDTSPSANVEKVNNIKEAVLETSSAVPASTNDRDVVRTYVINTNSKLYHYPSCSAAKKIGDSNRLVEDISAAELMNQGYAPCSKCNPPR